MSINLAKKYSGHVAERFKKVSRTEFAASKNYKFDGAESILVYSVDTVPLGNYVRSDTQRYGVPVDLKDSLQELKLTQDKAFCFIIDKGDDNDQMNVKGAARALRREIDEVVTDAVDKYRLEYGQRKPELSPRWTSLQSATLRSLSPTLRSS